MQTFNINEEDVTFVTVYINPTIFLKYSTSLMHIQAFSDEPSDR